MAKSSKSKTPGTARSVSTQPRAVQGPAAQAPAPTHLATVDSIQPRASRVDGWMNLLTGMGIAGKDKTLGTAFVQCLILGEGDLRDLYRGDGFAKRVIELPTREATRRGFELIGDKDRKVQGMFERRGIHKKVADMLRWNYLYGGSIGVMGIMDGLKLDMPVNEKAIERIDFLHVFDRWRVTWTSGDLYNDATNPKFGQPQFYSVNPPSGMPFKVHETRVLRMDGMPVDNQTRQQNQGWGDSVIQSCFTQLRSMAGVGKSIEVIVEDFMTSVIGMKDLADLLATEGGEERVRSRLNFLDMSRHVLRTFLIDADNETYTKQASTVTGLPDVMDQFNLRLAATRGIPITLLMGQSASGMDATGEGEMTNWYDQVRQEQVDYLQEPYERLCRYAFLSKECGRVEPADWKIEWKPLREPSQKELAEIRKLEAEEIDILINASVLDPEEVREMPQFKTRFNLKGPGPKPPPEDDPEKGGGTENNKGGKKPPVKV